MKTETETVLIREKEIAKNCYAIELVDFHRSLQKVIKEVGSSIHTATQIFQMTDLLEDIAIFVPVGHMAMQEDHWLCIFKKSPDEYSLKRSHISKLLEIIPEKKKPVILINRSYDEAWLYN